MVGAQVRAVRYPLVNGTYRVYLKLKRNKLN